MFGVEVVTRSGRDDSSVMIWLDFDDRGENKTYRLVISKEDAVYLRDHLDALLDEE